MPRPTQPVAAAIRELLPRIPNDLNWGCCGSMAHRPATITTPQFPSNWELSTARRHLGRQVLVDQASRRTAGRRGFGEFQPLDARNDELAYRRNRRIESS